MARAHDPCLSDALVARFLERTVSQPELCSIDQHVDRCSDCRALLGQLAHAIDDDELAATGLVTEPRAAPPPGLLARGTVIGRFVVIDVIGAGGMGTVYTVYDPELDRRAALKLLHHGSGERLRAEAQAMARVQHPNVVTVHDVGTYRDQVFVAMERVDGVTLRRWLARPRGWRELARVFAAAGEGLAAAHASGLVHRDFKPENVLVARDQHVKVGDFGLAGPASERVVGGTPAYMPPEAHTEQRALDARGDQYSFCVAFYEALHGRRPGVQVAFAAHVPRALRAVIRRGLSTVREDRYPSMRALLDDMQQRLGARRRWIATSIAVPLASVAVAGVVGATAARTPSPCETAGDDIARTWGAAHRERVRSGIRAVPVPFADPTAVRIVAGIDRYAAAWRAHRVSACTATAIDHVQSPALLDRRMACLDQLAVRLGVVRDTLAAADEQAVRNADSLLATLPAVSSCDDRGAMLAASALPSEPAMRARVARVQAGLAEAGALFDVARAEPASVRVGELAREVAALGSPQLAAEHAFLVTRAARARGDTAAMQRELLRTVVLARTAGLDVLEADARALLAIIARTQGDAAAATQLFDEADAAAAHAGRPPALEARLLERRASVLRLDSKDAEALRLDERHLSLVVASGTPLQVANARVALATSLRQLGRTADAWPQLEAALAVYTALLGPTHPDAAFAQVTRATLQYDAGRYADALVTIERAKARLAAALGLRAFELVDATRWRAHILLAMGRTDDGIAEFREAARLVTERLGPDSQTTRAALLDIAKALMVARRWRAAEQEASTVLANAERLGDRDGPIVLEALVLRAEACVRDGERARCIALLEHAIATLTPRWTRANMFVARASGELGVLLVQSEPTRARALLEEAVGNAAAQATFGAELAHHTTALAGLLYATVATRPRARDLVATARTACVAAGAACADTLARWLATHP